MMTRHCVFISLLFFIPFLCRGQTGAPSSLRSQDSIRNINFYFKTTDITLQLESFTPLNDSCANLKVSLADPVNSRISLEYNTSSLWSVASFRIKNSSVDPDDAVTTTITTDGKSNLKTVNIFFHNEMLAFNRAEENAVFASSAESLSYSLSRTAFICADKPLDKTVHRTFTYPAGYMRREPGFNYPELSMFHYGASIKIPTNESIRERGVLINYYQILNPPKLKYE